MKILLLALVFALLNRIRGGGPILGWKHPDGDFAAKIISGLLIGWAAVAHLHTIWALPLCLFLYMIGECFAWGKWVGTLAYWIPDTREVKGPVERAIHWIADRFYDDKRRPIPYAIVALALRGIVWWLPLFYYIGDPILGLIAGILMPACYVAANRLPEQHWINKWGLGEVIYGAVYGTFLGIAL